MSNNFRRLISLIPSENDDNFYNVYRRNTPSRKRLNSLSKKNSLNLDIQNVNPLLNQISIEKKSPKKAYLKKASKMQINTEREQEQALPLIKIRHPTNNNSYIFHKPIEDEKSKVRRKISPTGRQLSINKIIFKEDMSQKKKDNLSNSSSKKTIILLDKKKHINNLQKKLIDKAYEKELKQFKIYSQNMNEMIANQMVFEFFRKTKELQKLKSDDLMMNYIKDKNNVNSFSVNRKRREYSDEENNNKSYNNENDLFKEDKKNENLIVHNVFFEWIIANVIKRYVNQINPLNRNASIKFIRNILVNEIRTLSKIFFYKKKEIKEKDDSDIPRNMRIVRNLFGKYKVKQSDSNEKKKKDDIEILIENKRAEIKDELIEKIIEKIIGDNEDNQEDRYKSDEENLIQNLSPKRKNVKVINKSVDLNKIRKNKRKLSNETTKEISYKNENNINSNQEDIDTSKEQKNDIKRNQPKILEHKKLILPKISVGTSPNISINENNLDDTINNINNNNEINSYNNKKYNNIQQKNNYNEIINNENKKYNTQEAQPSKSI